MQEAETAPPATKTAKTATPQPPPPPAAAGKKFARKSAPPPPSGAETAAVATADDNMSEASVAILHSDLDKTKSSEGAQNNGK